MNAGSLGHTFLRVLHPDRTIDEVHDRAEDGDENESGEGPVDHIGQERKSEHVEADVDTELRVVDAERLRIPEQQPLAPLRHGRKTHEQAEENRHPDPKKA